MDPPSSQLAMVGTVNAVVREELEDGVVEEVRGYYHSTVLCAGYRHNSTVNGSFLK